MAKVLVIDPFPMDEENLSKRKAQLDAVRLGEAIEFDFKPVRIAPVNYVSEQDSVLADRYFRKPGCRHRLRVTTPFILIR